VATLGSIEFQVEVRAPQARNQTTSLRFIWSRLLGAKSKNRGNGRCVERPLIPSDAFVASAGAVRRRERTLFWAKLSRPAHTRNLGD
jgi:hypothetical protein